MNNNVIKVDNLVKKFGSKTAVNKLSFRVQKGEIYGLLGSNGAGKTTTIECLLGLKEFDQGSIELLAVDVAKDLYKNRKQLFNKIGVQFQNNAFPSKIKVNEMCDIREAVYENPLKWRDVFERFNITHLANRYVESLSNGERQKVFVALAIINEPEVLFLDELTNGLDPEARREMWELIKLINNEGTTIFMVSHYMDEIEYLCDYVSIIKDGSFITSGTIPEILSESDTNNMDEAFLYYMKKGDINL